MIQDVSSALRLVTAPSVEPLTLAQAKLFLRIEHTGDDDAITRAIPAARQFAERYLTKALLPQVWDYSVGQVEDCTLRLVFGPAQSITSITLTDALGNSSTLNTGNYRLSVDGHAVLFSYIPCAAKTTVRYSASIAATVADVPPLILQGMLHHIAAMMEARDGAAPLPVQSVNCYQAYRRILL